MHRRHKRRSVFHLYDSPLTVVDDFYVIAVAIAPDKTDAPLITDSDRVLSFLVSSKRFQLIPRRRSQNPQSRSCVELEQLPQGDALDGAKTLAVMILKEFLGVARAEALNHTPRMLRSALYVKHVNLKARQLLLCLLKTRSGYFPSGCNIVLWRGTLG